MSVRPRGLPCLPPMNRSQLAQPPPPCEDPARKIPRVVRRDGMDRRRPDGAPHRALPRTPRLRRPSLLRPPRRELCRVPIPPARSAHSRDPDLGARRGVDVCDTIKTSWVAYNFPEVYSPPPRDAGVVAPLVLAGPSFMRHRVAAPRQRSARRTTSARRSSSGGDDPPSSGDDDPPGSLGGPRRHRALARRWCR